MADYKEILGNIIGKINESGAVESVKDIYMKGAERTKNYARLTKLTLELNEENEELKRIYAEIGRLYYEQQMNSPEGFFVPLFAQAKEVSHSIVSKDAEISMLREELSSVGGKDLDSEIDAFDDVVSGSEPGNE